MTTRSPGADPGFNPRLRDGIEIPRRVDEAQNRILAMTIDRNDTTIRSIRRGHHPIGLHAFASEIRIECARQARHRQSERQGEPARRSAPRRPPDWRPCPRDLRRLREPRSFHRAAEARPLESRYRPRRCRSHGSSCPSSAAVALRQRARCSAEKTRRGFSIRMWSIVRWSMPWRFRRGTKCLRM